jgi:hypothetical protein
MPDTFVKIATATVGSSGASSIAFSSIPSTYTDLFVMCSLRGSSAAIFDYLAIDFNNGTSATKKQLQGTGSSVSSGTSTSLNFIIVGANATSNTFSNSSFYIPNYNSTTVKSVSIDTVTENNATTAYIELGAGLYTMGSNPITSVSLIGTTFLQYSTATLYGIKKD